MEDLLRQIAGFRAEYERDVLKLAEELRGQRMPELTEELFSEFERNGSRLGYEAAYFGRRKFLSVFGLVCVMGHRAEDIGKLEEILREVCQEECWALPAHVDRKGNPGWRLTVDLFASETAQTLAQLVTLLEGELSQPVAELVKREAEARVLAPFMASEAPYSGWERGSNNWNAVCCGNIGSTGLYLLREGAERRALAERIAHALSYYLGGFGDDGACEEGLGYWAYGFTYFTLFARQLKDAYPDMDILAGKKAEAIACFQQKCYFQGGRTVSFSDGNCFEPYPMGLTCSLAYDFDSVRFPEPEFARRLGQDACWRWAGVYWDWYWTGKFLEAAQGAEEAELKDGGEPVRKCIGEALRKDGSEPTQKCIGEASRKDGSEPSWKDRQILARASGDCGDAVFADVQWAVFRGARGSAAAVKGGHNGESHNHNDVGSFFYLADGEAFLDDLGCGEYTKDYFSDKRYTVFCNRGESHNIPLIDGCDQCAGREYRAGSFSVPEKGTAQIRFEEAYGKPCLKRLERRIHLDEETGELSVTDVAVADRAVEFKENLVTRLPAEVRDGQIVIRGKKNLAVIVPQGVRGGISLREVIHSSHQGEAELVRVLQWEVEPREIQADGMHVYRSTFTVYARPC